MSALLPPSESGPKFRVAICGAGIGGLILAITIGKYDSSIPIDLYEAHGSIETDGSGITVWTKTHQVIVDLGLSDDFKQICERRPPGGGGEIHLRRGDIREGGYAWFHKNRSPPSAAHRQDMVAMLQRHLPASCTVHAKKRLVKYVEPAPQDARSLSPIQLEFADGTTATTDILVGSDGIRSAVRKSMFQIASENDNEKTDLKQYIDATFTGIWMHRFLVPIEALKKETPENISLQGFTSYAGKGRYIVTYPIAKGTLLNVSASVNNPNLKDTHLEEHWTSPVTRDEIIRSYDDFEPDLRAVMELCENPSKWAMHVVKPLPFCVRKRVALIGDACHAMAPYLGAGGGQAMDDAYVLGRLIAHPMTSLSRIEATLKIYEEIRLPAAQTVARYALEFGQMVTFMAPEHYDGKRMEDGLDDRGVGTHEREGMEAIKQEVYKRWDATDDMPGALEVWPDAESKLRALAG